MAMNRQTRRHLQKQGEMSADGAPISNRDRRQAVGSAAANSYQHRYSYSDDLTSGDAHSQGGCSSVGVGAAAAAASASASIGSVSVREHEIMKYN